MAQVARKGERAHNQKHEEKVQRDLPRAGGALARPLVVVYQLRVASLLYLAPQSVQIE